MSSELPAADRVLQRRTAAAQTTPYPPAASARPAPPALSPVWPRHSSCPRLQPARKPPPPAAAPQRAQEPPRQPPLPAHTNSATQTNASSSVRVSLAAY